MNGWLLALGQLALFVLGAPLLTGWIRRLKARLQNRRGAAPWQPYRDLRRLFGKEVMLPETSSSIFRVTPYVVFASAVLTAAVVPLLSVALPTTQLADVIVLVGFMALGRFFQALAGLDTGTAFGGMGASREMTLSALTEPALLMAIFTLSLTAHSTNLSSVIGSVLDSGLVLRPSFLFALGGLLLVAVAETGRIPIDNPATHLELTMIHEAMVLEYSGRHLALIEWAAMIRLMTYGVLIVNLFAPWGMAGEVQPVALGLSVLWVTLKLGALAVILAASETVMAKMRLFRAPQFLSLAFLLALLGVLSHVI
ncbi:MAG: formate hydrogenlyase, partial [Gammaproteobacteria bacterium]